MHCPICLPKSTTASFLWRSQVSLHPALPLHKEPFKAELRLTGHTRAANSLRAHLCLERWHVLLISQPYDDPLLPPLPSVWIQTPNPQREREMLLRLNHSGGQKWMKTSVLQSVNSFKQLKTVKIDESKLLFAEQWGRETQSDTLFKVQRRDRASKKPPKKHLI